MGILYINEFYPAHLDITPGMGNYFMRNWDCCGLGPDPGKYSFFSLYKLIGAKTVPISREASWEN